MEASQVSSERRQLIHTLKLVLSKILASCEKLHLHDHWPKTKGTDLDWLQMFVCRWIYSTNDANEYTWLMFVCGFIFYLPNKIQLYNNCISMLGPGLLTNLGLHDVKDEVEGPVNHQFRPMNCFHIVHGSLNCTIFWGDQSMQTYGNFEGFHLYWHIVWVGEIMTCVVPHSICMSTVPWSPWSTDTRSFFPHDTSQLQVAWTTGRLLA